MLLARRAAMGCAAMRWVKAAICGAGIFVGVAAANTADSHNDRKATVDRPTHSTGPAKHARHSTQKHQNRSASRHGTTNIRKAERSSTRRSRKLASTERPVPKGGGTYTVGIPYEMAGRTYTPKADPNYRAEGKASWYGGNFHGRHTANGEKFDAHALSAAHPTLPLPSYVRVTNLENHRSLVVRLNDRGPYRGNRLIDVSVQAAKLLGFYDQGLAQVRVEYLSRAALKGSDDKQLAATLRNEPSAVQVASTTPIQPDTSDLSLDDYGSTLTQCIRSPTNSTFPQPLSFSGNQLEGLDCKPAILETKIAMLWPAKTLSQKSYCTADLALNRP
jgi:rare lipoprotein A (peptidoglycan hydrolase)